MVVNRNWNCPTVFNCDNFNRHEELYEKAKALGLESVSLIDDGKLQHLFMTSEVAKRYNLKTLIGCKFPFKIGSNEVVLALYPRGDVGLNFLSAMSTDYLENGEKPLSLEGKKEALSMMNVVIDASEGLSAGVVREVLLTLYNITTSQYLHVGVAEDALQSNKESNLEIKEILLKEDVGYIPYNRVLFLEKGDFKNFVDFKKIKKEETPVDYRNIFKSDGEIRGMFDYMIEVKDSSEKIFSDTNLNAVIEKRDIKLPNFKIREDFDMHPLFRTRFEEFIKISPEEKVKNASYLFSLVIKGLIQKYGKNKEAVERVLTELKVIIEKDFTNYFLIVLGIYRYAKENDIAVGPGRGSVVSSVAAFCLDLTEIEPLKYNLQFERFLNVYRLDYPDIDIDVSQRDREKIISYLKEEYGTEFVSQIVTKNNYGFKKVINEMIKVMKVPSDKVEKLKSLRAENFESVDELMASLNEEDVLFVRNSKDVRVLLERAFALRDITFGTSRHASGVLISSVPLKKEMPMMFDEHGLLTQIPNDNDTNSLEEMGFLKVDILGLRNLDVIKDTKKLIKLKTGKTLSEIPLDDEKTLKMLNEGRTEGVFQLESAGRFAKQIKVNHFNDIVALNALNRPGPMDNIPMFAERKGKPTKMFGRNKKELVGVEELYPIVEETNGVVVYQEQINELVRSWAGYTLGEADLFRSAVSKKKSDVLKKEREEFIKKAAVLNRDEKTTIQLYELILEFANYGFNKAHAVAYSLISYTCAYLKAHYTAEYMACLMNSVAGDSKAVAPYINEARRMGVEVLRPDINLSTDKYVVTENGIRCALQLVSNIGRKTAKALARIRGEKSFDSLKDVLDRISESEVGKSELKYLIRSGALDCLDERSWLISELSGEEFSYGYADMIKEEIKLTNTVFLVDGEMKSKILDTQQNLVNGVSGILSKVTPMLDKNKKEMAKVQLVDFDGKVHYLVVFHKAWEKFKTSLAEGAVVVGKVDNGVLDKVEAFQL